MSETVYKEIPSIEVLTSMAKHPKDRNAITRFKGIKDIDPEDVVQVFRDMKAFEIGFYNASLMPPDDRDRAWNPTPFITNDGERRIRLHEFSNFPLSTVNAMSLACAMYLAKKELHPTHGRLYTLPFQNSKGLFLLTLDDNQLLGLDAIVSRHLEI